MNPQKLAKLQQGVRIGGPGSMRRKHKAKRTRNTNTDEKRLTTTLKRLGVQQIPGIEEINMFKSDGTVIHFVNPKFQASGTANTYVVSGKAETKSLKDLLPGILDQLPQGGGASMAQLAEAFKSGLGGNLGGLGGEDIPDLIENFGESKVEEVKDQPAPTEETKTEEPKGIVQTVVDTVASLVTGGSTDQSNAASTNAASTAAPATAASETAQTEEHKGVVQTVVDAVAHLVHPTATTEQAQTPAATPAATTDNSAAEPSKTS